MTPPQKQPTIRPGQHTPYVKGTRQQIDGRRGYVARLLCAGKTKSQIHHAVRQKFNVEWRTTDRDIAFVTGIANKWLARARACARKHAFP